MLFLHYDANAQNSSNIGVCNRTQEVQDAIIYRLRADDCSSVTDYALSTIPYLDFIPRMPPYRRLKNLKAGDFSGLENLQELNLQGYQLDALPGKIFNGLKNLQILRLWDNQLVNLPEGIFNGLENLQELYLDRNQLTSLPEGIFSALRSLQHLSLQNNSLRTLPPGVFSRQIHMEKLYLDDNRLSYLPAGIFSGLDELWLLDIRDNQLNTLTESIFYDLKNLRGLYFYSDTESIAYNQDIFREDWSEFRNDMPPYPYFERILLLRRDIVLCEKDVRIELLRLYHDILSRTSPQYHIYIYGYNSTELAMGGDDGPGWDELDPEKKHGTGLSKYVGKDGIVVLPSILNHAFRNKYADVLLAKSPDKTSPEIIFRRNDRPGDYYKNLSSCSGILPGS